jgi:hypothetical protein
LGSDLCFQLLGNGFAGFLASTVRSIGGCLTHVNVLKMVCYCLSLGECRCSGVSTGRPSGVCKEVLRYGVVVDDVYVGRLIRVPANLSHACGRLGCNLILLVKIHLLLLLLQSEQDLLLVLLNLVHKSCGCIRFAPLRHHNRRLRLVKPLQVVRTPFSRV